MQVLFTLVFALLLAGLVRASRDRGVVDALRELLGGSRPVGRANRGGPLAPILLLPTLRGGRALGVAAAIPTESPPTEGDPMQSETDTETREHLIDLLDDFDTGMLVTRAGNGDLRSRPMHLARADEDGTLYFPTDAESVKADEIGDHPEDPGLRILKVAARRGEYWDVSGAGRVRYLWEAGKALVRGEEMEPVGAETHAKVEL